MTRPIEPAEVGATLKTETQRSRGSSLALPGQVPVFSQADLRDPANAERVERIWARVAHGLPEAGPPARARNSQPSRIWLAAACLSAAAFAAGVFVGRDSLSQRLATVSTPEDNSTSTVFATGTTERSFVLPSGSSLSLKPDSLVEVVRTSADSVTLSLLRGSVSVDGASNQAFAVLAGEARVTAAAGSRVSLTRRAEDVDVSVQAGAVEVSSPAGRHRILEGQSMASVPTYAWVFSNDHSQSREPQSPPVTPSPTARSPKEPTQEREPEVAVQVPQAPAATLPNWRSLANDGRYDEAAKALEAGVGLQTAIATAQSASELMSLSEIAGLAMRNPELRLRALHRAADEFATEPLGSAAAALLADNYQATNRELATKYRQIGSQAPALAETMHCQELRSFTVEANPVERRHLATRAAEYQHTYPKGTCRDQAAYVLAETKGDQALAEPAPSQAAPGEPTAAPSGSAVSPATSASSAPSAKASGER